MKLSAITFFLFFVFVPSFAIAERQDNLLYDVKPTASLNDVDTLRVDAFQDLQDQEEDEAIDFYAIKLKRFRVAGGYYWWKRRRILFTTSIYGLIRPGYFMLTKNCAVKRNTRVKLRRGTWRLGKRLVFNFSNPRRTLVCRVKKIVIK